MKKSRLTVLLLLYAAVFLSVICLQTLTPQNNDLRLAVNLITAGITSVIGLIFGLLLQNDGVEPQKEEPAKERIVTKEEYVAVMKKYGLTKRELELGFLVLSGYTNQRIAQELFISETTVKKHMTHIYEKTNVQGRKEFKKLFNSSCKLLRN